MKNAKAKGDFSDQIRQMDTQLSILYAMTNMTCRISAYPEISASYRDRGMELGEQFLSLREPDKFKEIEDQDCLELVLTNARFLPAFFENVKNDRKANEKVMSMMRDSLAISESDFYRSMVPYFDWDYYRFREESYVKLLLLRNRFLAGASGEEAYRNELMQLYVERKTDCYDLCGIAENILLPVEILSLLKDRRLTEQDKATLSSFYNNFTDYAFRMPNSGILSFLLECGRSAGEAERSAAHCLSCRSLP